MNLSETANELRRHADFIESIAAKAKIDLLDIAYLAIGAKDSWERYRKVIETHSQQEVIETVIAFAGNLNRVWATMGANYKGVWYYDMSEALGAWIVEQWAIRGCCPSIEEVDEYIIEVVTGARA